MKLNRIRFPVTIIFVGSIVLQINKNDFHKCGPRKMRANCEMTITGMLILVDVWPLDQPLAA